MTFRTENQHKQRGKKNRCTIFKIPHLYLQAGHLRCMLITAVSCYSGHKTAAAHSIHIITQDVYCSFILNCTKIIKMKKCSSFMTHLEFFVTSTFSQVSINHWGIFESFPALFFTDTLVKLYFPEALIVIVLKGLCVFSGRTRKLACVNDAVCFFLSISRSK